MTKEGSRALTIKAQIDDLKRTIATQYQRQIINYFGDEKKAMKFLSSVVSAVQRTPKLLECEPTSVINSFMTMAQLELMPSDVSGEAYVIPYNDKKKGMQAQFQLGYQGLVTLFYRAGVRSITAEIVYSNDSFSYKNGQIEHEPDVFADDRGKPKGAYVIVELQQGGRVSKVMKAADIVGIGKKFSKSFNSKFTPWNIANDPELWMWKKTVLKQVAKIVPKNETIYKAIAEDNKESNIAERLAAAEEETKSLTMGKLIKSEKTKKDEEGKNNQDQAQDGPAEGDQEPSYEPTN